MSSSAFPKIERPSILEHTKDNQEEHSGRMDAPAWVEAISAFFTALFTGALCLATYRLWNSTKGLYEETKRLAEGADEQSIKIDRSITEMARAASAAELTAKNLLRSTRPFVIVEAIKLETFSGAVPKCELAEGAYLMSIHGTLKNQGTASAFVKEVYVKARVGAAFDYPLPRTPQNTAVAGYEEIKVDGHYTPPVPLGPIALNEDFDRKLLPIFVRGWVRYADIHGVVRRSGFAFEYSHFLAEAIPGAGFSPCGDDVYWYDEEENFEKS